MPAHSHWWPKEGDQHIAYQILKSAVSAGISLLSFWRSQTRTDVCPDLYVQMYADDAVFLML